MPASLTDLGRSAGKAQKARSRARPSEPEKIQFISAILGKPDFSNVRFSIRKTPILVGDLITALINFLIIAAVLFVLVKAINRAVVKPKAVEQKKSKDCPYCLTPIPLAATKCPACTSAVDPVPAT